MSLRPHVDFASSLSFAGQLKALTKDMSDLVIDDQLLMQFEQAGKALIEAAPDKVISSDDMRAGLRSLGIALDDAEIARVLHWLVGDGVFERFKTPGKKPTMMYRLPDAPPKRSIVIPMAAPRRADKVKEVAMAAEMPREASSKIAPMPELHAESAQVAPGQWLSGARVAWVSRNGGGLIEAIVVKFVPQGVSVSETCNVAPRPREYPDVAEWDRYLVKTVSDRKWRTPRADTLLSPEGGVPADRSEDNQVVWKEVVQCDFMTAVEKMRDLEDRLAQTPPPEVLKALIAKAEAEIQYHEVLKTSLARLLQVQPAHRVGGAEVH